MSKWRLLPSSNWLTDSGLATQHGAIRVRTSGARASSSRSGMCRDFLLASVRTRFAWSKCWFIASIARSPWSLRTRCSSQADAFAIQADELRDDLLVRPAVE